MGRVQGPSAQLAAQLLRSDSLSCVLRNSVSDCEKGRLAGQILLTGKSEPIAILK